MPKKGKKPAKPEEVIAIKRPVPPKGINTNKARVWIDIVGSKPPDWFGVDTFPLLTAYCHHTVKAQEIDDKIEDVQFEPGTKIEHVDLLFKMRERETRAIMALARSMRLTQQSKLKAETAETKNRNQPGVVPWEFHNESDR